MKVRLVCVLAVALAAVCAAPAAAADRVVAAIGKTQIDGKDAYVEVLVRVPAGANAQAAKRRALRQQRATPAEPPVRSAYTFTGLVWDALPVVQSYNPAGAPVDAAGALQATHATWSSVSGSRFRMTYGGTTTRCPSLDAGCPGGLDGFNDVGWEQHGSGILGVTTYSTSADEADMTLNARTAWSVGCGSSGGIDLQTVLLHENGHVAGLGHSSDPSAIMYPSYQGVRCALGADDQAGIRALYPAG